MSQIEQTTLYLEAPVQRSGGKPALRALASAKRLARVAAKRLPWGSIAAFAAFLVMIALAVGLAWTDGDPDSGAADLGAKWLSGFQDFLGEVYGDLSLHILLLMVALGLVLERLIPARPQEKASYRLNIAYSGLVLLFVGAVFPLQIFFAERLVGWLGWQHIFDLTLDTGGSIPLVVAAMLVEALVVDFFFYWFHRCQHSFSVLWQVHLLHHSDMALNVTTTHRVHFLEHVLTPIFMIAPIMLLFELPDRDIYWIALAPSVWSYVVHANVRVGFGKFWWLLSSPQYHRIHHSIEKEHRDKNFAVWFPFYDVMFGTAHRPRPGEFPETGIAGVEVANLSEAFMLPFARWWDMARGVGRGGSSSVEDTEGAAKIIYQVSGKRLTYRRTSEAKTPRQKARRFIWWRARNS